MAQEAAEQEEEETEKTGAFVAFPESPLENQNRALLMSELWPPDDIVLLVQAVLPAENLRPVEELFSVVVELWPEPKDHRGVRRERC